MDHKHQLVSLLALASWGCIDTNLRDELNWSDFSAPANDEDDWATNQPENGGVLLPWDAGALSPEQTGPPPRLLPVGPCTASEHPFEQACASAGPWAVAFRLRASKPTTIQAVVEGWNLTGNDATPGEVHHLVLAVFAPDQPLSVRFHLVDRANQAYEAGPWDIGTTPLVATVVINEVLYDPLGPEPAQEFVELLNVGSIAVSLEGWVIADEGGQDELPPEMVPPGGLAVITPSSYVAGGGMDPSPPPGALVFPVSGAIGSAGLRNSGEALVLYGADGSQVAMVPASSQRLTEGTSLARRSPWAPDQDPENWAPHPGMMSSPGAPNQDL
jgi:hypothetical protein